MINKFKVEAGRIFSSTSGYFYMITSTDNKFFNLVSLDTGIQYITDEAKEVIEDTLRRGFRAVYGKITVTLNKE